MNGTPVAEIRVSASRNGKRVQNRSLESLKGMIEESLKNKT